MFVDYISSIPGSALHLLVDDDYTGDGHIRLSKSRQNKGME